jgi:hypothetical protein
VSPPVRVPVLTYHGINIHGGDYAENDNVALAADLAAIHALGWRVVPLRDVVAALGDPVAFSRLARCVALSCDDGAWFDWHDLEHPTAGPQRSFAGVLRDFRAATGAWAGMTAFVIVSPAARVVLDRTCLVGRGWWGDDWWPEAARGDVLDIQNHSWDHNHSTLPVTAQRDGVRGTFANIDTFDEADAEIRQASAWLDAHCPSRRTTLFAYPYGESTDYLVRDYLPTHGAAQGLTAAFDTTPAFVEVHSERWRLPRFVCGHDWRSPEALRALLLRAEMSP